MMDGATTVTLQELKFFWENFRQCNKDNVQVLYTFEMQMIIQTMVVVTMLLNYDFRWSGWNYFCTHMKCLSASRTYHLEMLSECSLAFYSLSLPVYVFNS